MRVKRSLKTCRHHASSNFFFFNDPATPEFYTLSLHDALPILGDPTSSVALFPLSAFPPPLLDNFAMRNFCLCGAGGQAELFGELVLGRWITGQEDLTQTSRDRKSTRLNSSHLVISYAVFCLKK